MSIATPNRARPALPSLVVAAVFALAAAIVAFGVIGLASAQAPPAAPTGVTVRSAGEGIVVRWNPNDAAAHRIAWMNRGEYESARDDADGDWTTALHYADAPSGNTYVVPAESLIEDDDYWFIVGSVDRQTPSVVSWGRWNLVTAVHGMSADDALTRAYVQAAIDFYAANGLDATVARYNSPASMEGERALFLLTPAALNVLAAPLDGLLLGPAVGALYEPLMRHASELAAEEGAFYELQGVNAVTGLGELQRAYIELHDGLVFWAAHSILLENVESATKEYVSKAIARYDAAGLEATIAYHNSPQSLDGQFYLFLIGADDIYLAHPVFPHLIGTDIKDVVGSNGYELGKAIAQATEEGIWVEYLWPHPVTRREQHKVTWAIRHDGLIFASGYYAGEPEIGSREWLEADPREYTLRYVHRAIKRYARDGLESMLNYYNSVASFEGQWYLFATDENDIYNVHPLLPHLRGTDLKDVVDSSGFELGKALARATEEGVWVEYLWPHPVTLLETPKISYAARHDGILFASGYYEAPANAAGRTQAYVQRAIDFYQENGREETAAFYGSQASFEGQWRLAMTNESDVLIVLHFLPQYIGAPIADLRTLDGQEIGKEMAAATAEGRWTTFIVPSPGASETVYGHAWSIRYDGLLFISTYYDDRPDVPDVPDVP